MNLVSPEEMIELGRLLNHDLRSPLRHIKEFHTLLIDSVEGGLDEDQQELNKYIHSAIAHANDQVDALAKYFKLCGHKIEREQVSVASVVDSALQKLSTDLNIETVSVNDTVQSDLFLDKTLIYIMIVELVKNGLIFQREGYAATVDIQLSVTDKTLSLTVCDNGIGIEPEARERAMKPLRKLNAFEDFPGIGIGLALVNLAVKISDGTLSIEKANDNKGTAVSIKIPVDN